MAMGMNFEGFFDGNDRQVVRGIPEELVQRVVGAHGGPGHVFFHDQDRWISSIASVDPEIYKLVVLQMLIESGCKLWLYTSFIDAVVVDRQVGAVRVATKAGTAQLTAKTFTDASGDAERRSSVATASASRAPPSYSGLAMSILPGLSAIGKSGLTQSTKRPGRSRMGAPRQSQILDTLRGPFAVAPPLPAPQGIYLGTYPGKR